MSAKLMDGIFHDKGNILEDLTVAHRDSLFTDITFTMLDNVQIVTNKFMHVGLLSLLPCCLGVTRMILETKLCWTAVTQK